MWLINVATLDLEEFFTDNTPPYAILSHTWGKDEVSYKDFTEKDWKTQDGAKKIIYACEQAIKDGLMYVWVDTCSIDKRSSAELSEAINSMWRWYKGSVVCYVYLADISLAHDTLAGSSTWKSLPETRWTTRGWTLQELLAPEKVRFFDSRWKFMGDRISLAPWLSRNTGINEKVLQDARSVKDASAALRMSWAANRQTTRVEDQAYCLLGLFDVNLPLLYGEGEKAFIRLQEEILRVSDDESILAWTEPDPDSDPRRQHGLLALSPSFFNESGDYVPFRIWNRNIAPITSTSIGMHLSGRGGEPYGRDSILRTAFIRCRHRLIGKYISIFTRAISSDAQQWTRVCGGELWMQDELPRGDSDPIYIRQIAQVPGATDVFPEMKIRLNIKVSPSWTLVGPIDRDGKDLNPTARVSANGDLGWDIEMPEITGSFGASYIVHPTAVTRMGYAVCLSSRVELSYQRAPCYSVTTLWNTGETFRERRLVAALMQQSKTGLRAPLIIYDMDQQAVIDNLAVRFSRLSTVGIDTYVLHISSVGEDSSSAQSTSTGAEQGANGKAPGGLSVRLQHLEERLLHDHACL